MPKRKIDYSKGKKFWQELLEHIDTNTNISHQHGAYVYDINIHGLYYCKCMYMRDISCQRRCKDCNDWINWVCPLCLHHMRVRSRMRHIKEFCESQVTDKIYLLREQNQKLDCLRVAITEQVK